MGFGRKGVSVMKRVPLLALLAVLCSHPAFAEMDFMGVWRPYRETRMAAA